MQFKQHKEFLLLALNRAVESSLQKARTHNAEALKNPDLDPDERAEREAYNTDVLPDETLKHVKHVSTIIMKAGNLDEFSKELHKEIQQAMGDAALERGDHNHYLQFRAFIESLYQEYGKILNQAPPSQLGVKGQEATVIEGDQEAISNRLLDAARFSVAGQRAIYAAMDFAMMSNPLQMSEEDRPLSFGHLGQAMFMRKNDITLKPGEALDLTKEQTEAMREHTHEMAVEVLSNFLPEECEPGVGMVEVFDLIKAAQSHAIRFCHGDDFDANKYDEYYKDEDVNAITYRLLAPIMRKYYPSMFDGFDAFATASHELDNRMKLLEEKGVDAVMEDDIPMLDIAAAQKPKRPPLMDVKDRADPKLAWAVRWTMKRMDKAFKRMIAHSEELEKNHAEFSDPGYIDSEELAVRREEITRALEDLHVQVKEAFTIYDQQSVLEDFQYGAFKDMLYGWMMPESYGDLRAAIDLMQERLSGKIYNSGTHPWVDCFKKIAEAGEMNDQCYDDICNMFVAQQMAKGKPAELCFPTPYHAALDDFFDGQYDGHELSDEEHQEIEELAEVLVENMLDPYNEAMPDDYPPNLAWFIARGTEFHARSEIPAKRIAEAGPKKPGERFTVVNGDRQPNPDPEHLSAVTAHRRSFRLVQDEKDPMQHVEEPAVAIETMPLSKAFMDTNVQFKVNGMVGDLFASAGCTNAAYDLDHLLAAKAKMEAKIKPVTRAPQDPNSPAFA